ncbi:hypothetical protein [Myroides sp. DW712]|uniref:hypothetical protein n=1 Tax=Myroides sp. DW712 TaxID=3389800 RepID=UPI00397B42CC
MSQIVIKRNAEFSNKLRSIALYCGDQKIGEIKDGETKAFDLQPGHHTLCAKIDWCRSNKETFHLQQGETLFFDLSGTNPILAIYYITLGKNSYLKLRPRV